ncbi:MAG: hypothetical protein HYV40_02720 [Candidatus Levybacteria bacterium]|nr:hypothetical protein [Candidatus Levybacteria bacterium]
MSPTANNLGFLYLDQNGMLIYMTTTPTVIQFPFPLDIVRDLEIINKDLLQKEVNELFKNNAIPPTRFILALSPNLLFEKVFTNAKDPQAQADIQQFLDNIPFERTGTIIFENAESKLIATNKDLYQTLTKIIQELGSVVEYIMPAYVLGIDVNQALSMNQAVLNDIHRKAPSLRQYSFLVESPAINPKASDTRIPNSSTNKPSEKPQENGDKKRLFLLLGIFVILILILAIVAYLSFGNPNP